MRKIILFMMVSLDGYVEGVDHDLSWHNVDGEFNEFAAKQMSEAGTILFGRKTYQLMENYWPSKSGLEDDRIVANLMNTTPKVVFSHSLEKVVETNIWKNVTLVKNNITEKIQQVKQENEKDIFVLGSNNLCVSLLEHNLLDEVRLMVNPIVIGEGTPLFLGIKTRQNLTLATTRVFNNGNVLLTYNR
ncbi:MAG TPA: dihydrofolate reductase family protein [Patescibacteria group bacterium]|nr:dihydrofolate reductase family protein [Patescibacteria group bacterium]